MPVSLLHVEFQKTRRRPRNIHLTYGVQKYQLTVNFTNFNVIINSKSFKKQRDQRSHVKIKTAESADSALFMPYHPPYDTRVKDEYEGQMIINYHQ